MKRLTRIARIWPVALLLTAGFAYADNQEMPTAGTVNYVEGQVSLQGQTLTRKSIGDAVLDTNQVMRTEDGNAEVLLTPGVFLRIGHQSEVRMLSAGLADTKVELLSGTATLEVSQLFKENNIGVVVNGSLTQVRKHGLYAFDAARPSVAVIDGEATVFNGRHPFFVHKGHQALLSANAPHKEKKYNRTQVESDPLYLWSKLRSEYESQANVDAARNVVNNGDWYGAGWYFDPFWDSYAFMPGDGIMYSPFGWGYYSPGWVGYAPSNYYPYHNNGYSNSGRNNPGAGYAHGRVGGAYAHNGAATRGGSFARSGGFARPYARPAMGGGSMGGFSGGGGMGGFHGGGGMGGFHGGGGMARGR